MNARNSIHQIKQVNMHSTRFFSTLSAAHFYEFSHLFCLFDAFDLFLVLYGEAKLLQVEYSTNSFSRFDHNTQMLIKRQILQIFATFHIAFTIYYYSARLSESIPLSILFRMKGFTTFYSYLWYEQKIFANDTNLLSKCNRGTEPAETFVKIALNRFTARLLFLSPHSFHSSGELLCLSNEFILRMIQWGDSWSYTTKRIQMVNNLSKSTLNNTLSIWYQVYGNFHFILFFFNEYNYSFIAHLLKKISSIKFKQLRNQKLCPQMSCWILLAYFSI